jgi:hypothetical protein
MVHIYYHIYAVDGVEEIINEQLSLIDAHFDFPYILNIGISIGNDNKSNEWIYTKIIKRQNSNWRMRDIRANGHEFVTLDLIEKDKEKFGDSDYILYLHTKGASKIGLNDYGNIQSWRRLMNYFNIEKAKNVFQIFQRSNFNTYGVLFTSIANWRIYSGNFWWMTGEYARSLKLDGIRKSRTNAETGFIQNGVDWKPYSPYNREGENHYLIEFKREEYAK